jgi:hypothetical protein
VTGPVGGSAETGRSVYDMADLITMVTGEAAGVVTLPWPATLAALALHRQVTARRPVMVITKDAWDFFEPRYGLIGRYAYEVRDVSPDNLIRLHCSLGRYQAQPKPLHIDAFFELVRPEIATTHPENVQKVSRIADLTGPCHAPRGDDEEHTDEH